MKNKTYYLMSRFGNTYGKAKTIATIKRQAKAYGSALEWDKDLFIVQQGEFKGVVWRRSLVRAVISYQKASKESFYNDSTMKEMIKNDYLEAIKGDFKGKYIPFTEVLK